MKSKKEIQNVELAFNCPQDWGSMTVCNGGCFCNGCQKIVYDFTDKSQKDYKAMLRQHDGQICGRFQQKQMKPRVSFAKVVALSALSFGVTEGVAQKQDLESHQIMKEPTKPTIKQVTQETFMGFIIEPQPEFIGGQAAMYKYLGEHICYPESAREAGIEGTVYVGFVVEKDGRITDVTIKRGLSPDVNAEAICVVKSMSGKWKAAIRNGKPEKCNFTIPIRLCLE